MKYVRSSLLAMAVLIAMIIIGLAPMMIVYAAAYEVAAVSVALSDPQPSGGITHAPEPSRKDDESKDLPEKEGDGPRDHEPTETTQPETTEAKPAISTGSPNASGATQERIQEDDPRWNCSTMGNLQCGSSAQPSYAPQSPQLADTGIMPNEILLIGLFLCLAGSVLWFIAQAIRNPER